MDSPDYDELAKRYLDLWQEQWTAAAADPQLAAQTARLFQTMAGQLAPGMLGAMMPWGQGMPGVMPGFPMPPGGADEHVAGGADRDGAKAGAKAAAAARDDRDELLAQLTARLAGLEERLAALEAGGAGGRKPAQRRPRKSAAKRK